MALGHCNRPFDSARPASCSPTSAAPGKCPFTKSWSVAVSPGPRRREGDINEDTRRDSARSQRTAGGRRGRAAGARRRAGVVKLFASGICHSQLHQLHNPALVRPLLLGHEATGVVLGQGQGRHARQRRRPRHGHLGAARRLRRHAGAHTGQPQLQGQRRELAGVDDLVRGTRWRTSSTSCRCRTTSDRRHGDHRLCRDDRRRRGDEHGAGRQGRLGGGLRRRRRRAVHHPGLLGARRRPADRGRHRRREARVRQDASARRSGSTAPRRTRSSASSRSPTAASTSPSTRSASRARWSRSCRP